MGLRVDESSSVDRLSWRLDQRLPLRVAASRRLLLGRGWRAASSGSSRSGRRSWLPTALGTARTLVSILDLLLETDTDLALAIPVPEEADDNGDRVDSQEDDKDDAVDSRLDDGVGRDARRGVDVGARKDEGEELVLHSNGEDAGG